MAIRLRPFIVTLLLATYGLISACGAGLHTLVDVPHRAVATGCCSEGDHSSPCPPVSDHSDCLICLVAGQGQLVLQPEPICLEWVAVGRVIAIPPTDQHPPDRLPSDPRAPPFPLV